jgi:hypothetical protein
MLTKGKSPLFLRHVVYSERGNYKGFRKSLALNGGGMIASAHDT